MDLERPSMTSERAAQVTPVISYKELETILRMALTAPSGDNCQPWRFTWNDETLAVFYEDSLGHHALNNDNHATWLSLGCLLETIAIASSGYRLRPHVQTDFENWKTKPVAVIHFTRETRPTDPLVSEIMRRKTHRTEFTNEPLPANIQQQMQSQAHRFQGCSFSFKPGAPEALFNYLSICDEGMWRNRHVAHDFLAWARLSDSESLRHADGMSWKSLGIQKKDLLPLRIFRRLPGLISWLWNIGFKKSVNLTTRKALQSNAGVYAIAIADSSPDSVTEAGRLAYRLWLMLNAENFAVQPLSLGSLTAFDVMTGFPPPHTSPEMIAHYHSGYKELKAYFGFSESQLPVWMFRTGKPRTPGLAPMTPRVKIQDRLKVYTRDLTSA